MKPWRLLDQHVDLFSPDKAPFGPELASTVLNLALGYARAVSAAAARGDREAQAFLDALLRPDECCALCDQEVGREGTILLLPDPKMPDMALLMAECRDCAGRPDRKLREKRLLRAISGLAAQSRTGQPPGLFQLCGRRPAVDPNPADGRWCLPATDK